MDQSIMFRFLINNMKTNGVVCFGFLSMTVIGVFTCPDGWFGASCQYMCHCTGGNCRPSGECRENVTCERGWFGPLCQYDDTSRDFKSVISVPTLQPELTLDDDDKTCTGNISVLSVTWRKAFIFTWLRVTLKYPGHSGSLSLGFLSGQLQMPCNQQRHFPVSATTSDIYCTVDSPVQQVNVHFDVAREVCSLYISGGRNVALKQKTNQSSVWEEFGTKHTSSLAVDGNKNQFLENKTCSHTNRNEREASWSIFLKRPARVSRYALYSRRRKHHYSSEVYTSPRLKGFILQSFTADRVLQFNYQDGSTEGQLVYSVVPIDHSQPVSRVDIRANNTEDHLLVELCEVEVFGDEVCPAGYYGFDCNETCNCSVKCETSYSWSLGCPRCPFGYQGFVCDERKALKTIPELPSIIWTCLVSFIVTGCLSFTLLTLVVVIVCLCCRHRKSARRTSLEQFRDGRTSNPYSVSSFISQSSDQTTEEPPYYLNVSEMTMETR